LKHITEIIYNTIEELIYTSKVTYVHCMKEREAVVHMCMSDAFSSSLGSIYVGQLQ
jgi:hypothetical protein